MFIIFWNATVSKDVEDDNQEPIHKEGRKLRQRSAASTGLHETINKTIKKKKENTGSFKSERDVRKFYLNINKNIKAVKPVLLETIFEEEEEEDKISSIKKLGKASKRTLTIKDGYNISKALTNKRKSIIKKKLGNRKKKSKKVALKKFIEDFKTKTNDFAEQ